MDFFAPLNHNVAVMPSSPSLLRLLCISIFLFLIAVSCDAPAPRATNANVKELIVPRGSNGIVLYGQHHPEFENTEQTAQAAPRITLPDNQLLQQVIQQNLDGDVSDEQIVVYKVRDESEDLLHIAVVDFDDARNAWFASWQSPTRASNIKTFSLRVQDLTGDGLPEIVCNGVDNKGQQTLDIFRLSKQSFPLSYTSVLSVGADISIEISQPDTQSTDSGENGQAPPTDPARAATISTLTKDLESTNPLDMVQTEYTWRNTQGQFIVSATRRIPGNSVQEAQLDQLFKGNVADFETFLGGSWVRNFNRGPQAVLQVLFFDPVERTLRLIEGDRLESHQWISSRKPTYGARLQLFLTNEAVRSLKSVASITPTGVNTLTFTLQDREDWTGDFQRLTPELEDKAFGSSNRNIALNPLILSGLYKSENGLEIVFSNPRFTWRQGQEKRQGGFLSFQLNETVLQFYFVNQSGLIEGELTYVAQAKDEKNGNETKHVLELRPATLTVNGAQLASNEVIRLEQSPEAAQ